MSAKVPLVLLVNPNTNTSTTLMMRELAAAEFTDSDLLVVGITALAGPRMLIDPANLDGAKVHVREVVKDYLSGPDGSRVIAIIVAAIGDPGRAELSLELAIPVVGIGEAAILAASRNGRRFGMATSTPLLVPSLTELVMAHQRTEYFCGVRLTESDPLTLAANPEAQFLELQAAVRRCVADGAKAVIIAGGPLSETARRLSKEPNAAIIEPLPSACQLIRERLRTGEPATL
ncbi:aspartate/glutamate racemase family protein [Arthrobacter sp. H14-L1]|uniref:aspartate/glutamate racemase family protein n=1 Tax=Arthrobacter sp. H14-L1 TaxID=2996697 RepID=UPI002270D7BF|nr:aspartate/glutamate racemase family protein [Arthrobacter sp. H14-L1]MCY0903327.1 aspartate/glutamate racemase family protein [Arthrobacter sp. H14-L1]